MAEFGQTGRTVLFVSHDMSAITRLCERTILLRDGRIMEDGPSHKVVSTYLSDDSDTTAFREWPEPSKAPKGQFASLCAVRVRSVDGRVTETLDIRDGGTIEMEYEVLEDGHVLIPGFRVDNDEAEVFSTFDLDPTWRKRSRPKGRYVSTVHLPGNFLSEGRHMVSIGLALAEPWTSQFSQTHIVSFQVFEGLEIGLARGDYSGRFGGAVRPVLKWTTRFTPSTTRLYPEMTKP
jgi:lipopolysaccharide transport system ATP-binding protein